MPFYTFNTLNLPVDYSLKDSEVEKIENNENNTKENINNNSNVKEISFNLSESFFQIPLSLTDKKETDLSTVFCIPETQYTPNVLDEKNLMVNVTADQSVLLPSISSVLEASARSAQNHRRKSSSHFPAPAPIHQRVADKLEMPSQNPNSPLFKATADSISMDLTENSLVLALNSSIILVDEKNNFEGGKSAKFSLDFLNTPPLKQQQEQQLEESNERVSTQVLLQNLGDDSSTQLLPNYHQEISLISNDGEDDKLFDPMNLLPNTPREREDFNVDKSNSEAHDAIFFPNSFDEGNNPFFSEVASVNANLDESMKQEHEDKDKSRSFISSDKPTSNFEARLRSATSPPQDIFIGPKRIVLSARKTATPKPAPLSIKSSKSSTDLSKNSPMKSCLSASRSVSCESVPMPEPMKKSLGARLKRTAQSTSKTQTVEPTSTPMTPIKLETISEEAKYLDHMMKVENKRISTIIAEPRKTPIAGCMKTLSASRLSKVNNGNCSSGPETPSKKPIEIVANTPKSRIKETSLASYYTDLALSSPYNPETPIIRKNVLEPEESPAISDTTSSLDSRSNLYFKENQWVFFSGGSNSNNNSSMTTSNHYLVGSIVSKTSKTRDLWRVKQSNGAESTVSGLEMCPIAFLRPSDEVYFRSKKHANGIVDVSGPFKFKCFSLQNSLMIELFRESPRQLYDCLKLTRISIERETFLRVRERFSRGCIEDSQIRSQIMNFNENEGEMNNSVVRNKKLKRTMDEESFQQQLTPSQKRLRQAKIFQDYKFIITTGDNNNTDTESKEKYTKLIESLGGEVLTNLPTDFEIPLLKTYLLSNGFKRTPKYMTAIIRGVPRVYFNWIESCCAQGCFNEPFSSFLIDPKSECKPTGLLFKNKKFFISGSAKFKNSWISVIRLLGGTVSNSPASTTIVLRESEEKGVKGPVEKFVNVDWLINCIVSKKFI